MPDAPERQALPLVVYGAGGHGKVVADILLAAGQAVVGFLDDGRGIGTLILGLPVLGSAEWLRGNPARVALGVGDNHARARAADSVVLAGGLLVAAVHPRAVVAASARVEAGAVVMAMAVINADASVAAGVIVNTGAIVEHDCVVQRFAHVSPNAVMGGGCHVGELAHLGIGAVMLPRTRVGDGAVVGGGAVVTRDVPARSLVVGVPARERAQNWK